jgi:hypothetical protein
MNNLSLTLTSAKCELLDNILKEFGDEKYIKAERISKLFKGNEILASEYLSLLLQLELIILVGEVQGYPLPAMIGKQSGMDMFLSEGGFIRRFQLKKMQEEAGKNLDELQVDNMRLRHTLEMLREKYLALQEENTRLESELKSFKNA